VDDWFVVDGPSVSSATASSHLSASSSMQTAVTPKGPAPFNPADDMIESCGQGCECTDALMKQIGEEYCRLLCVVKRRDKAKKAAQPTSASSNQ
jgi:hypothetical protein